MSIQNIMNVCFAICITLFIYQNQQLKSDIELLEFKLDTQEGTKKIADVDNLATLLELEASVETLMFSMEDVIIQQRMLFKRDDEIVAKLNADDERETKNAKTLNQAIEAIKFNEKKIINLVEAIRESL
jgi:hypothetical protein